MAKVLSETDLTDIHQALDVMANKHQQESSKFIRLEQLKNNLISEGDSEVEALLTKYNLMERQKLRQLVRQARAEQKAEKIGKYNRNLLNYLKQYIVD
jgi:ribosome-associated protein